MQDGADHETEDLFRQWTQSEQRSRQRRQRIPRPRHKALLWAGCVTVATCVATLALALGYPKNAPAPHGWGASLAGPFAVDARAARRPPNPRPRLPSVAALRKAWGYARERGGDVSVAVVDTRGRLRGRRADTGFVSASVVKAMLLAAELRRLERDGLALDPATQGLLRAMITESDNDAADSIYLRVGDAGLSDVARSARLRRFTVAGYWANAQITAADMARYFSRLPQLLAGPDRKWGLALFGAITKEQRWGVPRAAGRPWSVFFKGGWRATGQGELVHQVALLRDGNRHLAIAVLTDAQPSQLYAIHTVRGIADRLLERRSLVTVRRRSGTTERDQGPESGTATAPVRAGATR